MSEKIVQFNEEIIKGQLKELVCSSVVALISPKLDNIGRIWSTA